MPYNPGVNDISGQIMGNAIQNLGGTIANTIAAYKAKTDENKDFQSKVKATEGYLKAHPTDFATSKEEMDAMLARDPNETDKGRYERLSSVVDNAVLGAKMKQMQAQQQQQEQMQAAFAQNKQLAQYQNGQGVGVYSPQMQAKLKSMLSDPNVANAVSLQSASGQVASPKDLIDAQAAGGHARPMMTFPSVKALQEKYPGSQYDYNFVEQPNGSVSVDKISPRAPINGQIEPGFEADPANPGSVRPIKGGTAWQKAEDAKQAQVENVRMVNDRSDTIVNTVDAVIPQIDNLTSGIGGTLLSKIPATQALDIKKNIQTIKAAIGIDQLQQMRAAAKNGASGFGQLSERELDVVQTAISNLDQDQSPKQLVQNLNKIKTHFQRFQMAVNGVDPDKSSKATPTVKLPSGWSIK
jgi:hypothetical protein